MCTYLDAAVAVSLAAMRSSRTVGATGMSLLRNNVEIVGTGLQLVVAPERFVSVVPQSRCPVVITGYHLCTNNT